MFYDNKILEDLITIIKDSIKELQISNGKDDLLDKLDKLVDGNLLLDDLKQKYTDMINDLNDLDLLDSILDQFTKEINDALITFGKFDDFDAYYKNELKDLRYGDEGKLELDRIYQTIKNLLDANNPNYDELKGMLDVNLELLKK